MTVIALHVAMLAFGLYLDTNMWNMVMPKLFGLPHLNYAQMFIGALAIRFITSTDYTTPILWNKYLQGMTKDGKKEAIKERYFTYVLGQIAFFAIVWGITKVCL